MKNRIVATAADANSRQEAVQLVLAGLAATHAHARDVSLDEAKSLLVDALRAWREKNVGLPRRQHTAITNEPAGSSLCGVT